MKNGQFLGLLVRKEHAQKFLEGKQYEIRSSPVQFLNPKDQVALVSNDSGQRQVLAILRFKRNLQISLDDFTDLYDKHKVKLADFLRMRDSWKKKDDHCWAWDFELVRDLSSYKCMVPVKHGSEIWVYFSRGQLLFQDGFPVRAKDSICVNICIYAYIHTNYIYLSIYIYMCVKTLTYTNM